MEMAMVGTTSLGARMVEAAKRAGTKLGLTQAAVTELHTMSRQQRRALERRLEKKAGQNIRKAKRRARA